MTNNKDWLPAREDALVDLIAIWQTKLSNTTLQTAYGWVATECTAALATFTAFLTARTAYQAAPTKANRDQKAETKKTAQDTLRKFARERIRYNTKMTTAQREELGIPAPDPEPSPVPVPKEGPASKAETSAHAPGVVAVHYLGAKPYGVDRVEIAWGVLDAPVDDAQSLPHRDTISRNPWEQTLAQARGKKLYYALRYLAREGASHWTEVRDVIVP